MRQSLEEILRLERAMRLTKNQWEPIGFKEYELAVGEFVATSGIRETIELAESLEEMARRGESASPWSICPLLTAFAERYGGTPELYVLIYEYLQACGGEALPKAPKYIKMAYQKDQDNYYVLWVMFLDHYYTHSVHGPTFPPELLLSDDRVEHEVECLRRILKAEPNDELARTALEWIQEHRRSYHLSAEDDVPVSVTEISLQRLPESRYSIPQILEIAYQQSRGEPKF